MTSPDRELVRGGAPLLAVGTTDTGLRRADNEDALALLDRWVVLADGLGGHRGGEVAAQAAVAEAAVALAEGDAVVDVVRRAQTAVVEAAALAGVPEAGTTLVVAGLEGDELVVAHVGDSRAGLLHDGQLRWLTTDHNEAAELVALGELTEAEAFDHPGQHVLTRNLGAFGSGRADVGRWPVPRGSRLLVCSDGLCGYVGDEAVAATGALPLAQAVAELVARAWDVGAPDNITVALADL